MHTNDVADSLAHGELVELVCEEHERNVLRFSFVVDGQRSVSDFESADILVVLVEGSMRESSVDDDSVEVHIVASDLALCEWSIRVVRFNFELGLLACHLYYF